MSKLAIQESSNVELVAYHPAEGRPPFKFALQQTGRRWYLYCSHLWLAAGAFSTSPMRAAGAAELARRTIEHLDHPGAGRREADHRTGENRRRHDARAQAWGHDPSRPWDEGSSSGIRKTG
jgi:hypothetical protein